MKRGRWARGVLVLALLGATLGTALDGIHSHFGATAYTHPVFWRAAWWVPLLFSAAFTLGLLRPLIDRLLSRPSSYASFPRPVAARAARHVGAQVPSWPGVGLAFGVFIAAYFASVLPVAWPTVALLLAALFAVSFGLCDRTGRGLGISVVAALGGPAVESALVHRGLFVHLHPLAFGVPGWLPFLYLCAATALTTLARRLVDA